MKQLSFFFSILFTFIFCHIGISQSVSLTGPSTVETGIAGTFTATFNPGTQTGITIVSYVFSAPWIGAGISGGSGLVGSINGNTTTNPLTVTSSSTSSSATIIWGDFFNGTFSDVVTVTVNFKQDNIDKKVTNTKSVTVFRVCAPIIEGSTSLQSCCTSPATYKILSGSACDANVFTWTVTGGATIASGNGTATITVTPLTSAGFTITCVVRRSTGLTTYSRTSSSFTVIRFPPATPPISAPEYFCIGTEYNVSIPSICGMASVAWNVPTFLQITSGNGTANIKVKAIAGTQGGTIGTITAQANMTGGCTASNAQRNFTVYGSETPPIPQGYITLELESGTVCNDPVYKVVFHTTTPYTNGYTSTSPGVVLGNKPSTKPINISVCNVNLCSGISRCIVFTISPPQPCGGRAMDESLVAQQIPDTDQTSDRTAATGQNSIVYPNPSSGEIFLSCPVGTEGRYEIYESSGRLVKSDKLGSSPMYTLTEQPLSKGIYFVRLHTPSSSSTQKIIIQ